jgi:hypothetical protein
MTHKQEAAIIDECISRDGRSAYLRAKEYGIAYTIRGNAIVRTDSNDSVVVVNIGQVKVRVKGNEKVIVID